MFSELIKSQTKIKVKICVSMADVRHYLKLNSKKTEMYHTARVDCFSVRDPEMLFYLCNNAQLLQVPPYRA